MEYTSILQIPSFKDSKLMKEIARIKTKLAKTTGYHVKLVERLGRPLPILFSKNLSGPKYHRAECAPCANPHTKGPSFSNLKKTYISLARSNTIGESLSDTLFKKPSAKKS